MAAEVGICKSHHTVPFIERDGNFTLTSKVACVAIAAVALALAPGVSGEEMTFAACYNACVQQDAYPVESAGKVFSCFLSCVPHLTAFL